MNNRNDEQYQSDYTEWSTRIERQLKRCIKVLVVLLVLAQLVLQFPLIRQWISTTDSTEGVPYRYIPRQ